MLLAAALIASNAAFSPVLYPSTSQYSSFSSLAMAKRSERAFIEKGLEDAMNNDWRLFRAHLVAREQVESSQVSKSETSAKEEKSSTKQSDLGDMFADAISSIFSKKDKDDNGKHDIFEGDTVGGASSALSDDYLKCEDPFLSREELPILMNSKVSLDKRRWAHTIPHLEPGCVLVANEKLGGVFHQTVVLIIDHCESQGSNGIIINRYVKTGNTFMGLVGQACVLCHFRVIVCLFINRPLKGDLQAVAAMQNTTLDLSLKLAFSKAPVTYGGPVNADEFSILHGFGEVEGARKLAPGIFVGGSEELMNEVRINRLNPKHALFVKGHAAWVAGQLTREISKGVWYPASCSSDLILRYAGAPTAEQDASGDLWSDIMHCLGEEYVQIARSNAGRGDHRMMP